jgi:hypothetical protein
MAKTHGRNGALYVDTSAGANSTAQLISYMADYSVSGSRDRVEVTSFGDNTKTFVAGLADASGTINGFYDDASNSIYQVADGSARAFYIYVNATSTANMAPIAGSGKGYWYGTGTFDTSTTVGVADAAKVTLNWSAATSVYKV